MVETTTHETVNMYPWLGNAMKFWLDKINETLNIAEFCERETMRKIPSKYITASDYVEKTLSVLSAISSAIILFKVQKWYREYKSKNFKDQ